MKKKSELLGSEQSCLVIIDIQEKLVPTICNVNKMIGQCSILIKAASLFGVPMILSEHYPDKLGETDKKISSLLDHNTSVITKTTMSCASNDDFIQSIEKIKKQQVVIIGMEAHVCVLQTAIELKSQGKDVYVVADAISSRAEESIALARARMRQYGIHIVNTEMVLFEWLKHGDHPVFRDVIKLIK